MFKNLLLRGVVGALNPFIPKHPVQERFLIVATTALGDTLWATPAIESLRRSFPKAYIAVLTSPVGMEVLKHNPHIDRLHLWRRGLNLYSERFDTVLVLHASQRLILPFCSLLGARRLVGTAGINKGLDRLLTHPLPNVRQHEIERRLAIIEQVGAKVYTEKLIFYLQPHEELPARKGGPWIALHPGSKDEFKRWPAAYFIEVGKQLKDLFGCEILVTGSKGEYPLMKQVASQIPGAHVDLPDRSLRNFAALLKQMDLLISNDTGPVHLACALDRPVLAIYSSTDPALCGPHQARSAVALSRQASCTPCLKRKCLQPFCLLQISPEEVVAAAKNWVSP